MPDAYYALKMILNVSQCEINFFFLNNCPCEIDISRACNVADAQH